MEDQDGNAIHSPYVLSGGHEMDETEGEGKGGEQLFPHHRYSSLGELKI